MFILFLGLDDDFRTGSDQILRTDFQIILNYVYIVSGGHGPIICCHQAKWKKGGLGTTL